MSNLRRVLESTDKPECLLVCRREKLETADLVPALIHILNSTCSKTLISSRIFHSFSPFILPSISYFFYKHISFTLKCVIRLSEALPDILHVKNFSLPIVLIENCHMSCVRALRVCSASRMTALPSKESSGAPLIGLTAKCKTKRCRFCR